MNGPAQTCYACSTHLRPELRLAVRIAAELATNKTGAASRAVPAAVRLDFGVLFPHTGWPLPAGLGTLDTAVVVAVVVCSVVRLAVRGPLLSAGAWQQLRRCVTPLGNWCCSAGAGSRCLPDECSDSASRRRILPPPAATRLSAGVPSAEGAGRREVVRQYRWLLEMRRRLEQAAQYHRWHYEPPTYRQQRTQKGSEWTEFIIPLDTLLVNSEMNHSTVCLKKRCSHIHSEP